MKKFVSAFIVLAMVLAMLPMAVFAAPGTYELTIGSEQNIILPADDMVKLTITTADKDVVLKVDGKGTQYDWYLDNGMQCFYPNPMGFYELELAAGTSYTLNLVCDGCLDDQNLLVSAKVPMVGTEETPAELNMGENSATVDGMNPYFFKWTASEAGQLKISVDTDKCSDWSFQINGNLANGSVKYGDTNYSDVDPVVSTETVNVQPGDVYMINVNTANWGNAGTIYFNASFVAGDFGGEGGGEGGGAGGDYVGTLIESATVTVNSDSGMNEEDRVKVVTYTATETGTVYITMSSTGDGWSLLVYKNGEAITWRMTDNETKTFEYIVVPGDVMTFEMGAYDATVGWVAADGPITYVISFEAGDVEAEKELYIISDTILYLGSNDLTIIANAENTLFEFTPDETGVYKFTAPAGVKLGNWGMFFNPTDNTGDAKTNVLEWTCTDVGPSVLVGVAGSEDTVLEVERTGDYVPAPVIEWTEHQNTANLDYFELDENDDLIPVDVTDDVADSAVLGEDGFYHLNSPDGPILFADLNQYIYPATGYGKVSHIVYDEDGNVVEKINYTNAVIEYYQYADGGIYPLTADLIEFYKNYGADQGWYDAETMLGFYLFGEDTVDPETAWLFACYYDEDKTAFMSEYYVAGESGLCGSTWTPGDPANQMVMNADGTCSITYDNVAAGKYMFKVTQTDWDLDSWGGDGPDGNYVIELGAETYVTIVFNPATGEISVATGENVETGDYSIAGLVLAMLAATAGAVVLTKKKEF